MQVTEYARGARWRVGRGALPHRRRVARRRRELADEIRVEARTATRSSPPPSGSCRTTSATSASRWAAARTSRGSRPPSSPSATATARTKRSSSPRSCASSASRPIRRWSTPSCATRLDDFLPSPFLFDHVITQVIDGGKTYWIDGTLSDQGGTLATIDTPSDERALVVRPETNALTPIVIAQPRQHRRRGESSARDKQPMTLEVTSTYSGRDADDIRARAGQRIDRRRGEERISTATPPTIRASRRSARRRSADDRAAQRHRPARALRHPRSLEERLMDLLPARHRAASARPETLVRSMPLAIDYPRDVTERLIIRGGADAHVEDDDTSFWTAPRSTTNSMSGADAISSSPRRCAPQEMPCRLPRCRTIWPRSTRCATASHVTIEPAHAGRTPLDCRNRIRSRGHRSTVAVSP